jgi:hypothetical protein
MKKLLVLGVMLLGTIVHGQYQKPVKLSTITMADSYKGSSVRAYKVVSGYTKSQTNYLPADMQPNQEKPKPVYKGEWKTYDLDQKENDSIGYGGAHRTSDVAIYHGSKYPVYVSKKGKLFIWVTSSSGNTYRKYIN